MAKRDARSTHMSAERTIPLLRLLPGRPSRIFSSFTAFFGGILLLLLLTTVRTGLAKGVRMGEGRKLHRTRVVSCNAVPAARFVKRAEEAKGRHVSWMVDSLAACKQPCGILSQT